MEFHYLKNFITIVEEGSLTAAAKKLFVAQPALTNQLKVLEKEYGAELVKRGARKLTLTDAGAILYEKAKHIADLDNAAKKEVLACAEGGAGTLRLGLTPSTALTFFDGRLLRFSRENPGVKYELYEVDSVAIVGLLQSGVIEAGIVRTPFPAGKELTIDFVEKEQMAAVYHPDFFTFPEKIKVTELKDTPVCIIRRFEGLFDEVCRRAGFEPNLTCVDTQMMANLLWASQGMGVAIVPAGAPACLPGGELKAAEFDEEDFCTRRAIVTRKEHYRSPVMERFLALCREK